MFVLLESEREGCITSKAHPIIASCRLAASATKPLYSTNSSSNMFRMCLLAMRLKDSLGGGGGGGGSGEWLVITLVNTIRLVGCLRVYL